MGTNVSKYIKAFYTPSAIMAWYIFINNGVLKGYSCLTVYKVMPRHAIHRKCIMPCTRQSCERHWIYWNKIHKCFKSLLFHSFYYLLLSFYLFLCPSFIQHSLCSRSGLTYITVFWLSLHIAKNEVNALPSVRSIIYTKFPLILIPYIKIANLCQLIFHLFAFLCFFFEFRHFLLIEDNVTLLAKIMIALAICCTNKLNWGYFHTTGQLLLHHLFHTYAF